MPSKHLVAATIFATFVLAAQPASAKKKPEGPPPKQLTDLVSCRSIADNAQRLACYDQAAGAIDTALSTNEIVAFDKQGVREKKKGLFGFGISNLGIFGDDDDEVQVSEIEGVLAGVGHNRDGGLLFILKDSTQWSQIDSKALAFDPDPGSKLIVKRAALGSYVLRVEGFPGVKVKRVK